MTSSKRQPNCVLTNYVYEVLKCCFPLHQLVYAHNEVHMITSTTNACSIYERLKWYKIYNKSVKISMSSVVWWHIWNFGNARKSSSPPFSLFHSLYSPLLLSLFSPIFPSPPLSGGNNFNDFPENQLTIDFAFLCKPAWWNATVSPFTLVLISFVGTAFPHKMGTAFPHVPPRLRHCKSYTYS